ncbi:MAG: 16S rRNA (adenine(1518)-N(6)/adenine(1519)-N(6))-dimethyltransferase RsmA [Anaerolineae bacterium]|nr:16S rRNA (adenine(1518)-N(6)/adenine(1519)-N(6))-dimethyltransferase RsmA [Anaerolineae bacterium]MDW8101775.1 16S rRNA (adenine(1518)-N(6)/adenine(1519)-N(6))-dimethyltransferase RsmA [Anaerolineae bacterium]
MEAQDPRKILKEKGIRPRKSLGQHFMISPTGMRKIMEALAPCPQDVIVEVGAGTGFLTVPLAQRVAKVIAVEIDRRLVEVLREVCAVLPNVTIVEGDVLEFPPGALLEQGRCAGVPYKLAGNLPYYIASAILRHFLENTPRPSVIVVTVQKEVAQKILAHPGEMSLLSVSVRLYSRPELITYLPPGAFFPPPEVDSAVVRLEVLPEPLVPAGEEEGFFRIVKAGFGGKRKTLRNAFKRGLGLPAEVVERLLTEAGINPERRAETLTIEEWIKIWETSRRLHL